MKKLLMLMLLVSSVAQKSIAQLDTVYRLLYDTVEYQLEFNRTKEKLYDGTLYVYGNISSIDKRILSEWDLEQIRERKLEKSWINKEIPLFGFKDIDGKLIDTNTIKDKVVLINFWFVQCASCIGEMPELNELKKEYENKGIVFLSMTYEKEESIRKFLETQKFDYAHIPNAKKYINQFGNSYPKNLIIDKVGKIRYIEGGLAQVFFEQKNGKPIEEFRVPEENLDKLRQKLDKLLSE